MAVYKLFVVLILNFAWEFGIMDAQRCTGYNLDSCECEGDYMLCRWVSFHTIIPSADSTRTRIIFINRPGELKIENRRYDLASWTNLKYVSTLTHKYKCQDGFCSEIFQNSNETTTDLHKTPKQMLDISTPLMEASPTPVNSNETLTDPHKTSKQMLGISTPLMEARSTPTTKINQIFGERTHTWIHQSSNAETTLTSAPQLTNKLPDSTSNNGDTHLITITTELPTKQENNTTSGGFDNKVKVGKNTPKHNWKTAFISCLVVFCIIIIFFIVLLLNLYKLLRKRPHNRILRSNPYHPMWQWDDTDL